MFAKSVIILLTILFKCEYRLESHSVGIGVISVQCSGYDRRQFNHFQEPEQEHSALRQLYSQYMKDSKKEKEINGPDRSLFYNPTYGYEPYWKTGDWVFIRQKRPKNTTYDPESDCGLPCFKAYLDYGPICGRNATGSYRNFTSICAMRTFDCRGLAGWTVVHRGDCRRLMKQYSYPNTHFRYTREPITRALSIIADFSKLFPGVNDDTRWA